MNRRNFIGRAVAGGTLSGAAAAAQQRTDFRNFFQEHDVVIERDQPGQPHKGKVFAAIQPHCDDIPLFAAGTVLKLIREGYTGILIRITNDEMAGRGKTMAEVVLNNEKDNFEVARRLGLRKVFDLNYRNHRLDSESAMEIRARLIFIFRIMKVDTVISYDPWGFCEGNPDHYVTAKCVDAACGQAGGRWDFPEHLEAGIKPHSVREKYYYSRGPQLVNRIVDISSAIDQKIDVNIANVTQGPAGETGARVRARLAAQKLRLPILGDNDGTANREYIKRVVLQDNAEWGQKYGLQYAEPFLYIRVGVLRPDEFAVDDYIKANAVPL